LYPPRPSALSPPLPAGAAAPESETSGFALVAGASVDAAALVLELEAPEVVLAAGVFVEPHPATTVAIIAANASAMILFLILSLHFLDFFAADIIHFFLMGFPPFS
jgi:hypothetical protein